MDLTSKAITIHWIVPYSKKMFLRKSSKARSFVRAMSVLEQQAHRAELTLAMGAVLVMHHPQLLVLVFQLGPKLVLEFLFPWLYLF